MSSSVLFRKASALTQTSTSQRVTTRQIGKLLYLSKAGVRNWQPMGRMWPAGDFSPAHQIFIYLFFPHLQKALKAALRLDLPM